MNLTDPRSVRHFLREAGKNLSMAHAAAGETEGDRTDLIGPVRDAIFGLNSTLDALVAMIEESDPA